jgi:hypothetical protein
MKYWGHSPSSNSNLISLLSSAMASMNFEMLTNLLNFHLNLLFAIDNYNYTYSFCIIVLVTNKFTLKPTYIITNVHQRNEAQLYVFVVWIFKSYVVNYLVLPSVVISYGLELSYRITFMSRILGKSGHPVLHIKFMVNFKEVFQIPKFHGQFRCGWALPWIRVFKLSYVWLPGKTSHMVKI